MSKNQIKKTTSQAKNTSNSTFNEGKDNPKEAQSQEEKVVEQVAEQVVSKQDVKVLNNKADTDKSDTNKAKNNEATKNTTDKKSPSFFSRFKWVLIWLIFFAAIAAAVLFTRKDLDWQVQHINDLQAQVAQLNQAQQILEARVDTQFKEAEQRLLARVDSEIKTKVNQSVQSNVDKSLALPEHQAIVTQADIDKVQQATQQQLSQLHQKLSALGEQALQQTQQVLSGASELAETTKQALQPTPETEKALAEIEEKLQTQLTQVGNKLVELFEFKSEQQALSTKATATEPSENLSLERLQHWIIEVNTQWLLRGNVAETRTQLTALQQAVAISQVSNATRLASLVRQDLSYLERYQTQQQTQSQLNTDALKQAIQSLSNTVNSEPQQQGQQQGGEKNLNEAETTTDLTFDSAVEQLKQTLSGMVSIKKRDSEAEMTQVESLILQDVLIQRALLLVDRIDWAIVSQSNTQLTQAVQDLQTYMDRTFRQDSAKFKTLLTPFASHQFEARQSLAIRGWLVNQK